MLGLARTIQRWRIARITLHDERKNAMLAAMPHTTAPNHESPAPQLPGEVYHHLVHTLRLSLPPPLTDSPEDLARRDYAAIARIAALQPANAAEADIGVLYVAASEQWRECLRLAQQPDMPFLGAMKCRAQANAMMRQSQSALRLLLRMQAARQKLGADSEARDRAAATEQRAINLMTEALSSPAGPATITEPLAQQATSPCGLRWYNKRESIFLSPGHSPCRGSRPDLQSVGLVHQLGR